MSKQEKHYPDISDEAFTAKMLYKMIRTKFPQVRQVSTGTLKSWLDDANTLLTVLIVDVRESEEHEVSMLHGAIHIPSGSSLQPVLDKIKLSSSIKKVVAYCSVGYRSSEFIQRIYGELKQQKFYYREIELYNLEGSIFKWANEGKPITDKNGQETIYVHPYNIIWGKFLNADRRSCQ